MLEFVTTTSGGGTFFKAADMADALALLIEPSKIEHNVPSDFGERSLVTADVTVFRNAGQLDGSDKPTVNLGMKIGGTVLVDELEKIIGKAGIFKMGKGKAKPGRQAANIFLPVDPAIAEQVIAYATKRDEELASEMPDF